MTAWYPSPCTPQSGRTYVARGRDVKLDTLLIQGLVLMTRKTKYVNMGGLALRELCVGFRLHCR